MEVRNCQIEPEIIVFVSDAYRYLVKKKGGPVDRPFCIQSADQLQPMMAFSVALGRMTAATLSAGAW